MQEIVAKTVTEVVTGVLIEETVAKIIEAGVKTVSIGTTMDADRPAMAAPVTIVAASHAREAEMIEAEKIADKANRKGHFVVEIFQEEKIRHFVLNIRHQEADIVMNPPGMGEIAVVNDRLLLHAEKTRTNDSIVV